MTISFWRSSHLILAVVASLLLILASVTGILLAVDAATEARPPYSKQELEHINLAQTLSTLRQVYSEITELSVDHHGWITLQALDEAGDDVHHYIDPHTGKIIGEPHKPSEFIQDVLAFHRSLFIHEAGRFLVGLSAFLLLLMAVTGVMLIIRRQHGVRRFFSRIVKEYLLQYLHVELGRLLLIPVVLIAVTGTWLSLDRFELLGKEEIQPVIRAARTVTGDEAGDVTTFEVMKNISLTQVQRVTFPFDVDPEEYYTVTLLDREIVVNQFNGEVQSTAHFPVTTALKRISLNLHTGRTSVVWAVILAIASVGILFFIYSGFAMTIQRVGTRIRNRYTADDSEYVILVGSENGSTRRFARSVHEQLLARGQRSFLAELNDYTLFPRMRHLFVMTSTHGLGDPPSNALRFQQRLQTTPQHQAVNVSVLGFGSRAYPNFCGYAEVVDEALRAQPWATPMLPLHTVDDKSMEQFAAWVQAIAAKTGVKLEVDHTLHHRMPADLQKMMVLERTAVTDDDQTFVITLKPSWRTRFTSGDLLAVYPAGDARERLYSIGQVDGNLQLVVRLFPGGLGSSYLYQLTPGTSIHARIIRNMSFHFPAHAPAVVMIANGTGIAPFLGMISGNRRRVPAYLYGGFRQETSTVQRYQEAARVAIQQQQLQQVHFAYSRIDQPAYVTDLVRRDGDFLADILQRGGVVLICGSRAMQEGVEQALDTLCHLRNGQHLSHYKAQGQVLADCY